MSTTPAPATGFWAKLKTLLPAIELAGNIALLATPFAGFEPLIAKLEDATQPLVQSIGSGNTTEQEVIVLYGTAIGVLTTLKAQPNLPQATLTQIDAYITAAEAGTAAYIQAESGFNPALYTPVQPIA